MHSLVGHRGGAGGRGLWDELKIIKLGTNASYRASTSLEIY